MTDRDIMSLALKITGFAWLLRAVSEVHTALNGLCFVNYSIDGVKVYSQAYGLRVMGCLAVTVLVVVVLLVFSDGLSKLVIREGRPLSDKTIFGVAVSLIGIIIVALGATSLCAAVTGALRIGELRTRVAGSWDLSMIVQAGVAILVGVCLAAYARKVVDMTYNPKEYFSKVKEYHTRKEFDS
ncbi:MAG: hypothetical protein ACYC64_09650 [Armatimonadota bacterium]